MASPNPADLASLKIMPLSSMLTALLPHLDSFHFQILWDLAHSVPSIWKTPLSPTPMLHIAQSHFHAYVLLPQRGLSSLELVPL